MQDTNNASKSSKGDGKFIQDTLTLITIPKEHTDFIFYPKLE
jgi:cell division protein FtsW (lipid II flippase)